VEVDGWSAEAGGLRGGGGWWWSTASECEQRLVKCAHSGLGFLGLLFSLFFWVMNEKGKKKKEKGNQSEAKTEKT